MDFKGCLREVAKVFQGYLKEVLRLFKEDLDVFPDICKGDSRELKRYIKEVQRVFQGNFKDVLRKDQGC